MSQKYKLIDLAANKLEYGSGAAAVDYDGEVRYIRITDIDENGKLTDNYVSPSTYDDKYILNDGDILFARTGATVGKTYRFKKTDGNCIFAGFLIRFIPNTDLVLSDYVYYFTKSPQYKQFVLQNMRVVAQPNINAKLYGDLEMFVHTLEEQKIIIENLNKIKKIIDLKKEELLLLDTLIKSRFVEIFGDTIRNTKRWELRRLDEIGILKSGGTPKRCNPEYFKGNINWYSAGELNDLFLTESIEKITEAAIEESSTKLFKAGSLLIGMYDTAAFKMGILKTDSTSNQACANIFPTEDVNVIWLYFNLTHMKEYFLSNRRGIRQKNLNLGMIKEFEIPVPPINIQNEFAIFTESVNNFKIKVQKSLEENQKLFDSLMQNYFE